MAVLIERIELIAFNWLDQGIDARDNFFDTFWITGYGLKMKVKKLFKTLRFSLLEALIHEHFVVKMVNWCRMKEHA